MSNNLDSGRMDDLIGALIDGCSIREAAKRADCAKGTAERYRRILDDINLAEDGFTTRRTGKRRSDGSCQVLKITRYYTSRTQFRAGGVA